MEQKVHLFLVSRSLFWSGYFSQPHMHDAYSIHYICAGRVDFEVEGQQATLEEGDCLLIPPFAQHLFRPVPAPGAQVQTMRLTVNDPFLDKQCRRIHPPLRGDATLRAMADYLAGSWKQPQPGQGDLAEAVITALLTLFAVHSSRQPEPDSRVIVTDGFSPATRRILHHIENHISEGISLEGLAAALNYNKNYLCTVFSEETGVSIVEYANMVRVRMAAMLFAFNKCTVAYVERYVGFHSTSYFSRMFRRLTGVAPGRFARAVSDLSREQWQQIVSGEPLLQYRPMSAQQLRGALEHIGQTARRLSGEE